MIIGDQDRKNGAIKYVVTSAFERMWKSSDMRSNQGQNYDAIKEEMYKLYPSLSNNVYTVHHLDTLVRQCTCLGIKSAAELGEFHLQFWAISKYLISKNRMSQAEQT